jgi:hypothetical protein
MSDKSEDGEAPEEPRHAVTMYLPRLLGAI